MTADASGRTSPPSGHLRSRDILRQGRVMFGAFLFSFFANAVFNMVMSRKLGVADYGVLISLLSVFMVVSVPLQTLQAVLTRAVAEKAGERKYRILSSLHGSTWVALAVGGAVLLTVGFVARMPLAHFLHLRAPDWIFHLAAMILGATAGTVTKAFLQGLQQYNEMGLQVMLDTLIRLVTAVTLVLLGVGVGGALFSQVLSSWVGAGLGIVFISFTLRPTFSLRPNWKWGRETRFAAPVALAFFLYALLTLSDVAFARHWFTATQAGYYSAAATVGRIFQHGPFMLTAYMFPKAAYMHTRGENVRLLLKKTLLLTCWVVGLSLLLCFILKDVIVRLLFGGQYADAAWMLPWYGLAMTPMAFSWILANYLLAIGKYRFLYGMGASILVYGVGMAAFHRGPADLLKILAVSGLVLFLWIAWEMKKERL